MDDNGDADMTDQEAPNTFNATNTANETITAAQNLELIIQGKTPFTVPVSNQQKQTGNHQVRKPSASVPIKRRTN